MATGGGFNLLDAFVQIGTEGLNDTEGELRRFAARLDESISRTRTVGVELDASALEGANQQFDGLAERIQRAAGLFGTGITGAEGFRAALDIAGDDAEKVAQNVAQIAEEADNVAAISEQTERDAFLAKAFADADARIKEARESAEALDETIKQTAEDSQGIIQQFPTVEVPAELQIDDGPLRRLFQGRQIPVEADTRGVTRSIDDIDRRLRGLGFNIDTGQLRGAVDIAEALKGETLQIPPAMLRYVTLAGRALTVVGGIATAAKAVFDLTVAQAEAESGITREKERQKQLEDDLQEAAQERLKSRKEQAEEEIKDTGQSDTLDSLKEELAIQQRIIDGQGGLEQQRNDAANALRDARSGDDFNAFGFRRRIDPEDRAELEKSAEESQARLDEENEKLKQLQETVDDLEKKQVEATEKKTKAQEKLNEQLQREIDLANLAQLRADGDNAQADRLEDRLARQDAERRFEDADDQGVRDRAGDIAVQNNQRQRDQEQRREAERERQEQARDTEKQQRDQQRDRDRRAAQAEQQARNRLRIEEQIAASRERIGQLEGFNNPEVLATTSTSQLGTISAPLESNLERIIEEERKQAELLSQLVANTGEGNQKVNRAIQDNAQAIQQLNGLLTQAANNGGLANC